MSDCLPPEVWINVLKRLTVKTLLRFRSVCKEWYSLITNPNFISQHLDTSLVTPHTLVRYCTLNPNDHFSFWVEHYSVRLDNNNAFEEYAKPEFPFQSSSSGFHVVGSCNGLLCLLESFLGPRLGSYLHNLRLWNPLIGKSVAIPRSEVSFTSGRCPHFHTLGFGFDELTNDYKVVVIMSLKVQGFPDQPRAEIYSLNSGIWREISPKGLRYSFPSLAPQAYLNGVAHWFAEEPGYPRSSTQCSCIETFNIKDEVFGEMMLPETGSTMLNGITMRVQKVTVLQDSLSFINVHDYNRYDADHNIWVWVMKEYGMQESWTLLFRVDYSSVLCWPVGFKMNGEFVMQTKRASLVSYDPESKQVKDLGIHGCARHQQLCFDQFYVGKYVESLVLLDRGANSPEHMVADQIEEEKIKKIYLKEPKRKRKRKEV